MYNKKGKTDGSENYADAGHFRLDEHISTSLLTSQVGSDIINYTYQPSAGFIKGFIPPYLSHDQLSPSSNVYMPYSTRRLAKTSFVPKTSTASCHYQVVKSSTSPYYMYPSYSFNYAQTLEHSSVFNPFVGDLTAFFFFF